MGCFNLDRWLCVEIKPIHVNEQERTIELSPLQNIQWVPSSICLYDVGLSMNVKFWNKTSGSSKTYSTLWYAIATNIKEHQIFQQSFAIYSCAVYHLQQVRNVSPPLLRNSFLNSSHVDPLNHLLILNFRLIWVNTFLTSGWNVE